MGSVSCSVPESALHFMDIGPHSSASLYSSALDAIQEALQLLESVRPEVQEQDCLLDDKAQALLWLYICTLETKMQEVSKTELVLLGMDQ